MAKRERNLAKERRWREAIEGQASSGHSVRAYCRREGLAESAFYFWRREIARRDVETPPPAKPWRPAVKPPNIRPVTAKSRSSSRRRAKSPKFLPVLVTGAASGSEKFAATATAHARERDALAPGVEREGLALELAGGRVLRLPEGIAALRLAEIVLALEAGAGP
jgi:hypothetical protein